MAVFPIRGKSFSGTIKKRRSAVFSVKQKNRLAPTQAVLLLHKSVYTVCGPLRTSNSPCPYYKPVPNNQRNTFFKKNSTFYEKIFVLKNVQNIAIKSRTSLHPW